MLCMVLLYLHMCSIITTLISIIDFDCLERIYFEKEIFIKTGTQIKLPKDNFTLCIDINIPLFLTIYL